MRRYDPVRMMIAGKAGIRGMGETTCHLPAREEDVTHVPPRRSTSGSGTGVTLVTPSTLGFADTSPTTIRRLPPRAGDIFLDAEDATTVTRIAA